MPPESFRYGLPEWKWVGKFQPQPFDLGRGLPKPGTAEWDAVVNVINEIVSGMSAPSSDGGKGEDGMDAEEPKMRRYRVAVRDSDGDSNSAAVWAFSADTAQKFVENTLAAMAMFCSTANARGFSVSGVEEIEG